MGSQAVAARRAVTAGTVARSWRAFSLPVSVMPVIAAFAAVRGVHQWRWDLLAAAALGAGLLHVAGNLLNDYFDFRSGVDSRTEDDEGRPGRLLVTGQLLPKDVLIEAAICLVLAGVAGAYVAAVQGWMILAFAAAGAVGLYAYTGPPFALKYRGAGEVLIFLVFGPLLMTGAAFAATGRFEWAAAVLSVPIGLATTAIVVSNNIRDREEDARVAIRTVGQVGSGAAAKWTYALLVIGAAVGVAAIGLTRFGPVSLLGAPAVLVLAAGPIAAVKANRRLPDIDARTAKYAAALLAYVIVAYVVRGLMR